MPEGEFLSFDKRLDLRWQLKNSQVISNKSSVAPNPLGNLFLGQVQRVDQLFVGISFLDRIEFLTLDVFDQSELKDSVVGDFPDDCRNAGEPGQLSRAPASFARNQLEQATKSTDEKRLND